MYNIKLHQVYANLNCEVTCLIMFQCQSIWILLARHILEDELEDEKWAGTSKRDREFGKLLDKRLEKSVQEAQLMKRDSWRDTCRHWKRNRGRDNKETGRDKSMVRNNRERGRQWERKVVEFAHATDAYLLRAVDRHGEGWRQQHPCISRSSEPGPSLCSSEAELTHTVPEEGLLDGSKLV